MMKKKPLVADSGAEFKALKRNSIKCQRDLKRDRVGLERQERSLVTVTLHEIITEMSSSKLTSYLDRGH